MMKKRVSHDRRSGNDRRLQSDLRYLQTIGTDRRRSKHDRRTPKERRLAWIRGIKWRSFWIETIR